VVWLEQAVWPEQAGWQGNIMAWTAKLTNFERYAGMYHFSIAYLQDDIEVFADSYSQRSVTKKGMRNLARRVAADLAANDTNDIDIPIGSVIDVTPDPAPPPATPTQAELARIAWFDDYRRLQQMLQATADIPALATTQADTAIANLRTSLESGWLNSYLDGIQ